MLNIREYQKIEAIEELLDDYDLIMATLDADISLKKLRVELLETKLKIRKPANQKLFGYLRLMKFKKEAHLAELKKITYRHYQDGLHEKLNDLKK